MTLRCEISIVPFGVEEDKQELFRLNISNVGLIRNEGFGHEICIYETKVYRKIPPILLLEGDNEEWELIYTGIVPEHDRRDGVATLVKKACKLIEEKI